MYKIIFIIIGAAILPSLVFGYGESSYGYSKSSGGSGGGGGGGGYGYEEHYQPHPYKFGYDVKGHDGGLYQKEIGDEHGNKKGSYGYTDSYGIYRQVDYVADKHGFRATIKTNEPGTANENPAAVYIHSSAPAVDYSQDYGKKSGGGGGGGGSSYGGYGSLAAASSSFIKQTPSYLSSGGGSNQYGLMNSGSYQVPQYLKKYPSSAAASTTAPVYQMPEYIMEPSGKSASSSFQDMSYKTLASTSNQIPNIKLNPEQISRLYNLAMIINAKQSDSQ